MTPLQYARFYRKLLVQIAGRAQPQGHEWRVAAQEFVDAFDPAKPLVSPALLRAVSAGAKSANASLRGKLAAFATVHAKHCAETHEDATAIARCLDKALTDTTFELGKETAAVDEARARIAELEAGVREKVRCPKCDGKGTVSYMDYWSAGMFPQEAIRTENCAACIGGIPHWARELLERKA